MHGEEWRPGALDRPRPHRSEPHRVPPYLIYFGIPPFMAAFVVAVLDPLAGLALLACLTIMTVVLNVLLRHAS